MGQQETGFLLSEWIERGRKTEQALVMCKLNTIHVFQKRIRMPIRWTYELCFEEAKKYKRKYDFAKGSNGAYDCARRHGWLEKYTWFEKRQAPNKKWTKETCEQEARKYRTKADFKRGNQSAYTVAYRSGWMNAFDWFEDGYVVFGEKERKWTKETCEQEARKYSSKTEFHKAPGWAYNVALREGWLDEYTWLRDERFDIVNGEIDCVYGYFFPELNAVYIGRTLSRRIKERDKEHLFVNRDAVAKFAKKHSVKVPAMTIIEDNLTLAEGVEYEGKWVEFYKNEGWHILNRTKTGSIGGLGKGKWTKAKCKEEAMKYTVIADFRKQCPSAYSVACKNGWNKEYTWLEDGNRRAHDSRRKWNELTCRTEALKYKSRGEFGAKSKSAYGVARKNGWLKNYDWFIKPTNSRLKWTEEACRKEARKYKSKGEFQKSSVGAYNSAWKHGWLKTYDWFIKPTSSRLKWTEEVCRKEAKKYSSRSEFQHSSVGAYTAALKHGWLDEYNWFSEKPLFHYWDYETCKREASKYNTRTEFNKNAYQAYDVSRRNGWLAEFFS